MLMMGALDPRAKSLALLLACCLLCFRSAVGRGVRIEVKAPWPVFASAPVVEAAEFLSDFSPESFWSFADALCSVSLRVNALVADTAAAATASSSSSASPSGSTEQSSESRPYAELQALVYETASSLLPASMHNIMSTTIGLNAYAPAIQFYNSVFEATGGSPCGADVGAFAVVYPGGQSVCSAAEYEALRAKGFEAAAECSSSSGSLQCKEEDPAQDQSTTWDHVYPSPGSSKHVVLYGTLGTSSFCALHQLAKEDAIKDDTLRYSARHAFLKQTPLSAETTLPGYGVFLDIKNMEYNTANNGEDDVKKDSSTGSSGGGDKKKDDPLAGIADGVDSSGIYFSRLLERRPKDREELGILKEELDKARETAEAGAAAGGAGSGGRMKVWKIKDLGVQTVQAIASAASPVDKFAEYVHSFPSFATELSSVKLKATFVDSINTWVSSGMSQYIPHNCLLINGVRVDLSGQTFNVFDLLAVLKKELMQQARLLSLGLGSSDQAKLISAASQISGGGSSSGSGGAGGGGGGGAAAADEGIVRIDVSKGGKHVVVFLNNLEKDAQYKRWPKTMRSLLMPSWSLNPIARNLYSLIFVIDPMTIEGVSQIMQIHNMYSQQYPVRFGVVLVCAGGGDGATAKLPRAEFCQLFAKAKESHGTEATFALLLGLASHVSEALQASAVASGATEMDMASYQFPDISVDQLKKIYGSALQSIKSSWTSSAHATEAKEVLDKGLFADFAANCTQYLRDRGLRPNSFSLNGIVKSSAELGGLMQLLGREQYILANHYRRKQVTDKTKSIFSALLALGRSYTRYHPLLEEASAEYADALPSNAASTRLLAETRFLEAPGCADASASTLLRNTTLVLVPVSKQGLQSAAAAVRWLGGSPPNSCAHRLGLFFVASSGRLDTSEFSKVVALVASLQASLGATKAVPAIAAALQSVGEEASWTAKSAIAAVEATGLLDASALQAASASLRDSREAGSTLLAQLATAHQASAHAAAALSWSPSATEALVVYNARKLSLALDADSDGAIQQQQQQQPLHELDLELLSGHEYSRGGKLLEPLAAAGASAGAGTATDLLLRLASFAGQYSAGSRRHDVHGVLEEAGFTSSGEDRTAPAASAPFMFRVQASASANSDPASAAAAAAAASISVYCIVDPLSVAGQRAASVIKLLAQQLQVPVTVILTPKTEYTDFPLKSFYRLVLSSTLHGPSAVFSALPHQHTLTVRPDAPEPWNIQASAAVDDTDNLRCGGSGAACAASETAVTYKLKNVLAAGQCFQVSVGGVAQQPAPPKGLQLTLSALDVSSGAPAAVPEADTLVMQNLGYFQLLANPGLWRLDVAGTNYTILGPGSDEPATSSAAQLPSTRFVAVKAFTDAVTRVMVAKKADGAAALTAKASTSSVWGSLFGGSRSAAPGATSGEDETIHVFSLATGHMYERLLRIMMLSVVKRTSVRVKFWLFENFLSPTFKNVAAAMAEEFGFEVAYVTYKWPEWLTQQTEKQRIIWGYKILFLDVLFPLDVKKIIYVDADQVVRADLKELWDLDLQGKPYGYVPFCDSREETLGFQFWRSGYWADHLRGKPYHISALYVVDLQRFREYSVGDQLRAVYDGLARDPNSLANLDQDLPNYAQHSVPIHSLPQEWLWCETWCSDKTKSTAKTIDLCNNPLHKEPKLDMAKRVINGPPLFNESWVELDKEISDLRIRRGFVFAD